MESLLCRGLLLLAKLIEDKHLNEDLQDMARKLVCSVPWTAKQPVLRAFCLPYFGLYHSPDSYTAGSLEEFRACPSRDLLLVVEVIR